MSEQSPFNQMLSELQKDLDARDRQRISRAVQDSIRTIRSFVAEHLRKYSL